MATAVRLGEDGRAVALAGMARRQPHLSEPELAQELLRLLQRSRHRT